MSQAELTYGDIERKVAASTGLSHDEFTKRVDDKVAETNGLCTQYGAAVNVADKLGVVLFEKPAPPDPKDVIYPNDAGTCQYCNGKKTWGVKVPTRNGKMAPAHITDDGHLIGDCPNFAVGGAKPAAAAGTTAPFYTSQPKGVAALDALVKTSLDVGKPPVQVDLLASLLAPQKPVAKPSLFLCPKCSAVLGDGFQLSPVGARIWVCGGHTVTLTNGTWSITNHDVVPAKAIDLSFIVPATTPNMPAVPVSTKEAGTADSGRVGGKVEAVPPIFDTCGVCGVKIPPAVGGGFCPPHEAEFGTKKVQPIPEIVASAPWIPTRATEAVASMNTQEDHGVSITSIQQLTDYARAMEALPLFLSAINTKLEKLGVKDGIAGWMYEMLATKRKVVEMTDVDLQQQAINTAALASVEERLAATEGIAIGANGNTQELMARIVALEMAETLQKDSTDAKPAKPARKRAPAKEKAPEVKKAETIPEPPTPIAPA